MYYIHLFLILIPPSFTLLPLLSEFSVSRAARWVAYGKSWFNAWSCLSCFRKIQLSHSKLCFFFLLCVGVFVCVSLDNFLLKMQLSSRFKTALIWKKGSYFDLLFTFSVTMQEIGNSTYLIYINTRILLTLETFLVLPNLHKIRIYRMVSLCDSDPGWFLIRTYRPNLYEQQSGEQNLTLLPAKRLNSPGKGSRSIGNCSTHPLG